MLTETLSPTEGAASQRTRIERVVRDFNQQARSNSKARIYLIGYATVSDRLDSVKTISEGGRTKLDLRNARAIVIQYGAPPGKVIIVGVLAPDAKRAGE